MEHKESGDAGHSSGATGQVLINIRVYTVYITTCYHYTVERSFTFLLTGTKKNGYNATVHNVLYKCYMASRVTILEYLSRGDWKTLEYYFALHLRFGIWQHNTPKGFPVTKRQIFWYCRPKTRNKCCTCITFLKNQYWFTNTEINKFVLCFDL